MTEIGHVTGFRLFASPLVNGKTTISTDGGGVVRRDGKTLSYGTASISITEASAGQRKRIYLIYPGLLGASVEGNGFRSRNIRCDDEEMPRGAYEGGIVVLGHIELTEHVHQPVPQPLADGVEKPQDPRERTSMLRIIRALIKMAELPDKGATAGVEAQLQQLGFTSPKEAAVRKLLKEARTLQPD